MKGRNKNMSLNGFHKIKACTFPISLGDPVANADRINEKTEEAISNDVEIIVFPELSLTGYTCGDLFLRREFIYAVEYALKRIVDYRPDSNILKCIGMPVLNQDRLYNCAVYIQSGKILGVVPKTYMPNYNEFYEKRWFTSATYRQSDTVQLLLKTVPFSENLILESDDYYHEMRIGTEICEDLWVMESPSEKLCKAGANIIINPSASTETVGKSAYRRDLVRMQSARCMCTYVYVSSGEGESSTDLVFSGHCIIADNGKIVAENKYEDAVGIVDIEKCSSDRTKFNSDSWSKSEDIVKVPFKEMALLNTLPDYVDPYPFVPKDKEHLKERCLEILQLQSSGLSQRLISTGIEHVVIGLSGGLDSTLALLVCVKTFDYLKLPLTNIHCISMPGFGTTEKTKKLANMLAYDFGTSLEEIDIKAACKQHLKDIGHADDVYDIAYENVQARERTQILFDKANMLNALVIGTGDMSELALGWCTYNGDHMSNYAVNCSVPKTLVKYIVKTYANVFNKPILDEVYNLPISPELLPPDKDGNIKQKTEESIGKYDLHDFFLYHFVRNGFSKEKIGTLANIAFKDKVSPEEIEKTLDIFVDRFRTQQFKRSCIPDGVKIGSVSLSPRGDWRMPSDLKKIY